ncbi:MAG: Lrp/AsnC family transcriptional regulator [Candidatus Thorarchaeota archaeon]|nr:Lrp/AsnC family transcriptional regulator [Candidatus Thorarchaeota archaeon]
MDRGIGNELKKRRQREVHTKLSGDYLSLLIAIQENPLGTIDELSQRTGTSKPTVAKRLEKLQDEKVFRVQPLLDYHYLGLEAVDAIVRTETLEGILRIEEIAKKHPYTTYRARCYGFANGVLLQFRVPIGTRKHVIDLFQRLAKEEAITAYDLLPSNSISATYTSMRLEGWDSKTMRWTFNWDEWFRKKVEGGKREEASSPGSALAWFTKKDAHIIFELMDGARRKNIDIVKAIEKEGVYITPQTFSRRYQMIREECLKGYRVTFNREIFDLYNSVLLLGKGREELVNSLGEKLKKHLIPFESTYRAIGENLFWFIRLQSSHLSSLLTNLYTVLDDMRVCVIDYDHSYLYYLWPEAFDDESHTWRADSEFMVDGVLNK